MDITLPVSARHAYELLFGDKGKVDALFFDRMKYTNANTSVWAPPTGSLPDDFSDCYLIRSREFIVPVNIPLGKIFYLFTINETNFFSKVNEKEAKVDVKEYLVEKQDYL
jgi:hypothetical protein